MRSPIERLALCALSACALKTSFKDAPNAWTAAAAAVCQGTADQIFLKPSNPATLLDASGNVQVPTIAAVSGTAETPLSATWNGSVVVANAVATLAAGIYDIQITRISDHTVTTLKSALQVAGPPANLVITGQTACTAQSGTLVFTVTGDNVGALTAVTLSGVDTGPLATKPGATSNSLSVSVPLADKAPGTPYAITVSNGDGCSTPYTGQGVQIEPPPTVVGNPQSGPHLHSGALAKSAAVTVRVTGTALTSGTLVSVGGVPATSVAASPGVTNNTSVDATFAPDALTIGTSQAIKVANSSCNATVTATVNVGAPDMSITRLSPTGWSAGQQGVFFDAFGSLSQAGAGAILWINTSGSIFNDEWQQVNEFVQLDAAGNALRFATPSGALLSTTASSGAANVSVTSSDGHSHEAFIAGGVTLGAAAAPRIVWKDKDWIAANGTVSDTLTVYGCGLTGAKFKLIDANGADVPSGALPVIGTPDDGSWSEAQFKCTNGNGSADFSADVVSLQSTGVARGGPYRVRAFVPAAEGVPEVDADDLYPIMGYDETNLSLTESGVTLPKLQHARKNPNTLVAGDATGRRYLYVVGGAFGDGLTDPSEGNGDATYEFAALDPNNALLAWASNPADQTKPFNLNGDDSAAAYGMAAVADGTRLYFAGGASTSTIGTCSNAFPSNCNATAHVRQTTVNDPTTTATAGQLSDLDSPSNSLNGTNHRKIETSLCNAGDVDCDTTMNLGDYRYGAKAAIVTDGSTRKLLVFGGYDFADDLVGSVHSDLLYSFSIGADGLVPNSATGSDITPADTSTPVGRQAAQAFTFTPGGTGIIGTLQAVFGVLGGSAESQRLQRISIAAAPVACDTTHCACDDVFQYCNATTSTASGTGLNKSNCGAGANEPCFETGFGAVSIGGTMLMLGGTTRDTANGTNSWNGVSQPRLEDLSLALATATASPISSTPLQHERSLAGVLWTPPFVGVLSGIVCSAEFGGPPNCLLNTETAPQTATAEIFTLN